MSEPTDDEINKTLAEYMGLEGYAFHMEKGDTPKLFTNSLDSLVPVVEKLEFLSIRLDWATNGYRCIVENNLYEHVGIGKSPSKALALACYQVIRNIK